MKRLLFLVGLLLAIVTPNLAQTKTDTLYFEFDIDPNADFHEFVYRFPDAMRASIEVEYHDGQNQGRFKAEAVEQRMTVYGKGYWRIHYTHVQPFVYSALIGSREDTWSNERNIEIRERGVYLTSLDVSGCTALIDLDCSYNQLTSLDVSHNPALTTLYCAYNQLTSLDVSHNPALTTLYCYNNPLTSLDVSHNTALKNFSCYSNQLTNLDVSHNTALIDLDCSNNQLTSLDVSHNPSLTTLYCYNNQLTSLVVHNPALKWLRCDNNQLTSLDVSHNTTLKNFSCYSNQLTSLDVSHNTALESLSCSYNQLTSLDVSNNTVLRDLRCFNNQLTSLDVSHNPSLTTLYCYNNHIPLSTLYDIKKTSCYRFDAQNQTDTLLLPFNQVFDLSSERMLGENLSTFTLSPDSYTEDDFVFRFHKLAEYELTLQNSAIPDASITYYISIELPDNYFTVQVASGNSKWGTATIEGNGFYIEDASFYEKDSLVTITATPNEGYRFVNWTKQDGGVFSTEEVHTFAVTENLELTANFAVEYLTVNLFANNPEWGYVFRTGNNYKYEEGEKLTILALPTEGYRFVNWTNGGNEFSKEALFTFSVTENLELTANFALGDAANENRQDDNDNLRVYVQDRTIHLSENRGIVQVFNTLGQCVYNGTSTSIRVRQTGVYIVTVAGKNYKVLVM